MRRSNFILSIIGWLLALLLITFANRSHAAEIEMDVGKTFMGAQDKAGGIAGLGIRGSKYDVTLWYVGETTIYDESLPQRAFPLLTVSRVWRSERHLGARWEGIIGLGIKSADRCDYNGELNCNRKMPLPISFHFGLGAEFKDLRIELYHDSNDALDTGPEKKNLGLNWMTLTYRIPLHARQ
jgi:hypothetical protein